jgi:hypothetical protein
MASNLSNNGLIGAWNSGPGSMLLIGLGTNELRFYTSSGQLSAGTLALNTTYYIVGTFDGTYRRIYLNGLLVAGPTLGATPEASPGCAFEISGYATGAEAFGGIIDEGAYYDRALTDAEVWAHWQAAQI